ncbi:sigma-70 family RNA polymerase sigma factor [Algoriphagus sp. D3-2-R+10]|uniref:RNA polymerase sigma factor n=1 Tax=Algoriphagus aurantiacus TaxID=3103948 RepID=UPI002B3CE1C3|nr:sigma-70 family RNA polymerase sigma factor [Algoriphagus sp. D3-2-R+10]MEB2778676.1 sigma-70 family RNA polymerase sigma factor [Algoriphagus sp. D3-2-R+10]
MEEQELIRKCLQGDKRSLEQLIQSVQGFIFNLSLRFLWNRMDAEDATQEILIKIITHLSKFKGQSKFQTWAYRIATNYLINLKRSEIENVLTSFDIYAQDLKIYKAPIDYDLPDKELLEKEMKISCTLAMLQCLNREMRLTFILGSILKIKSNIGSEITNTTPENFRKRLEQSRKILSGFLTNNCGVYNPTNNCRCSHRINTALVCGRIEKNNLNYADKIDFYNEEMEELSSLTGIYQNHGSFKTKADFVNQLNQLISTKSIVTDN